MFRHYLQLIPDRRWLHIEKEKKMPKMLQERQNERMTRVAVEQYVLCRQVIKPGKTTGNR